MQDISVLIIDDEPAVLRAVGAVLKREHMDVSCAGSGTLALKKLEARTYDIILLDVMMPEQDGFALLETLRLRKIYTPVIMLSGRAEDAAQVEGLKLGADDYITKPFSAPELLARIRAVLRRNSSGSANDDTYCVGDFNIDFNKRIVNVNNETIRLTQVEYRIVELLARNPGKVLTYDYIMSNIWGPYADSENNRILRVNMSHIRKKLEPDSMKPRYILTEIGVGYRMAE